MLKGVSQLIIRCALRVGVTAQMTVAGNAWGQEWINFDSAVLEARGLSPQVAEYFRAAPRFDAGPNQVELIVNGASVGQVLALFDDEGHLCLDAQLLQQAGIEAPVSAVPGALGKARCPRLAQHFTDVLVRPDPGTQQVSLLVPVDWLTQSSPLQRTWSRGGVAGVLNYSALAVAVSGPSTSNQYRHINTEVGLNAGDWVLRSRQNYTQSDNHSRFENVYTQASRTWERYQANVQLGQLTLRSSLFGGGAFSGVQVLPDTGLTSRNGGLLGSGSAVEGVAYGPSRIELRQNGALIYTTLVPSGPFTLRDLPLLSLQLDLEVTIIEEGAEPRKFWVPAANLRPAGVVSTPGFALAGGQVRRFSNDKRDRPNFVAGTKEWQWDTATLFTAGAMAATDYHVLGLGLEHALTRYLRGNVQQLSSSAASTGIGQSTQVGLNVSVGPKLSANLTAIRRSKQFRTLDDTDADVPIDNPFARTERQWSASLSYADPYWGALSSSFSRYDGGSAGGISRVGAGWSRSFQGVNLSLSMDRDSGANARGLGVYATLSVPLGQSRNLSVYARRDDHRGARTGARYSEQLSDTARYSLATDRTETGQADFNARLGLVPRYASVDVGHSRSSRGNRSYDLTVEGGLAIHDQGVTASPYALQDTFGLIKVGDAAGVKVRTPQGPVWTDRAGRAVAPSLPAYQLSRLEVDHASLGSKTQVLNGFQQVEAGRGAVPRLDFAVSNHRPLMLNVRTDTGEWVPKGGGVYDRNGRYLTTVVDTGVVYLDDAPEPIVVLHLPLPGERRCIVELDTRQPAQTNAPYQTADASCRVIDL